VLPSDGSVSSLSAKRMEMRVELRGDVGTALNQSTKSQTQTGWITGERTKQ
jgi:hypothetical protein